MKPPPNPKTTWKNLHWTNIENKGATRTNCHSSQGNTHTAQHYQNVCGI